MGFDQRVANALGAALFILLAFQRGDRARDLGMVAWIQWTEFVGRALRSAHAREYVLDHSIESQPTSIFRGIDLLDTVALERGDLIGRDGSAATHDDADMGS